MHEHHSTARAPSTTLVALRAFSGGPLPRFAGAESACRTMVKRVLTSGLHAMKTLPRVAPL